MLFIQFIGSYESYDHIPFTPRSQAMPRTTSTARLTVHEQLNNPPTSISRTVNSESSSMQLSAMSENYCYTQHGLEMSVPASQCSSVTVNLQQGDNEVTGNSTMATHSLTTPMAEHGRDTPPPHTNNPHTKTIIIFTTSTEGETKV